MYLPGKAALLQALAEKMSNTIYRAAKVCSFTARHGKYPVNIHSLSFLSIHLMYDIQITYIHFFVHMI